ncbi:lipase member H-A-like [Bradysia coprophila]|uniref:lipase member H-A-like n=1 Tax=Bradysia coprophila TaxID=38358 RepID=UPI00187DC3CB|nr:lipase member H-A-like [Bradysia coprophila]
MNQGNSYDSKIIFYTGPTVADYVSYDLAIAQNVADHSQFNVTRTNMIYIHGWRQSPESKTTQVLLNAYLTNGTFNIFALDWRETAANDRYDVVVQSVEPLARAVALFIDRWNLQKGIPFSKIHLVGHSLGALMAGSVGKYTIGWSGQTKIIDRITGLDPAIIGNDFLQWRYARFVDIIHTDVNGFGTKRNTGHVDFWPNNGVAVQPGCPPIMANRGCSHNRAVLLYAESVQRANRTGNFLSTNDANASIVIEMGLNCPTTNEHIHGVYSLNTNGASWYSQS